MTDLPSSSRNSLPGSDDITRVQLDNGITILTRPNFNSPSVVITGYLQTGSLFDPDEKLGMANFTALALMTGTERHSFQQIYDTLESAGASLGFHSGVHTTGFNGRALAEDLPMLLDTMIEVLTQPSFPEQQVERLRAQLLTSLTIRAQDTGEMASMTFDEIVFAGHPYSRPEDGFIETVRAISIADLAAFHRQNYGPRQMVVVVVGAVDTNQVVAEVSRTLGKWQNPIQTEPPQLPPLAHLATSTRKHINIPGKSQTDLVMGGNGPTRRSPEFIATSLGNNIFGQFGMFGRIGDVVRERSGLAYYAYASLNSGVGPGSWEVSAGINPSNLEKTIDLIKTEIARFVSEPVSPGELSDSQANYIGRLPLSLESNNGVASALINLERYELGLDYYRNYASLVGSVTPEMILEAAQHYINPDYLAIASAGPTAERS
jgi:zinc protease